MVTLLISFLSQMQCNLRRLTTTFTRTTRERVRRWEKWEWENKNQLNLLAAVFLVASRVSCVFQCKERCSMWGGCTFFAHTNNLSLIHLSSLDGHNVMLNYKNASMNLALKYFSTRFIFFGSSTWGGVKRESVNVNEEESSTGGFPFPYSLSLRPQKMSFSLFCIPHLHLQLMWLKRNDKWCWRNVNHAYNSKVSADTSLFYTYIMMIMMMNINIKFK
jgi:hypothetical protein